MYCERCQVSAPTRHVTFYQNVGLLVMRFSRSLDGQVCKSCLHQSFWSMTMVNLLFGWWGIISLIVTPFFMLNNIWQYVANLGMEAVPAGAKHLELTDETIERIHPFIDRLVSELNDGQDIQAVADDIAQQAGVTSTQVLLFVQVLIAASENE